VPNIQKLLTPAPLAIVCSTLLFVGCGPSSGVGIGEVTGTVTLDERPLAGAMITFVPMDNVKESYGYTNEDGHYELVYKQDIKGAYIGQHHIRIETVSEEEPVEKLPVRYNRQTELTEVVESGVNKIDFDLTSKPKSK